MIIPVPSSIPKILAKVGPKKTDVENFISVPKIGPNLIFVKNKNKTEEKIVKNNFKIFFDFLSQIIF